NYSEVDLDSLRWAGAVYFYLLNSDGVFEFKSKFTPTDRAANDYFGYSVAISGGQLLVGAFQEDEDASGANTLSNAGSVYMYGISETAYYSEMVKMLPDTRAEFSYFGRSVAISGDYAIVG